MGGILASRVSAIVAACAVARDVDVIEVGREPRDSRVAIVAVVATGDVGWVLAGRSNAVVTGITGSEHLGMIDSKYG